MPRIVVKDRTIGYEVQPRVIDGSDLTVVMVHGSGGDKDDWKAQLEGLSETCSVVAVDLPGHGESDGPGELSVTAYAQWVSGFVKMLGLEQVVAVGCSLGSAIVQTLALQPEPWLRAIGLVGAGARLKVQPAFLDGFLHDSTKAIGMLVDFALFTGTGDPVREEVQNKFLSCPVETLYGDFSACNDFDVMDQVSRISMPSWIAVGAEDRLTPAKYSRYLVDKIIGSRLDIIPAAGHLVMMEQPREFNSLLKGFLAGLR